MEVDNFATKQLKGAYEMRRQIEIRRRIPPPKIREEDEKSKNQSKQPLSTANHRTNRETPSSRLLLAFMGFTVTQLGGICF